MRMLSTKKSKAVVGLDIEAGSVAAAEVGVNGHTAVGKFGIVPLGPGVFREGEVTDPGALGRRAQAALREGQALEDRTGGARESAGGGENPAPAADR